MFISIQTSLFHRTGYVPTLKLGARGKLNNGQKTYPEGHQSATANIEDAELALFTIQAALHFAREKAIKMKAAMAASSKSALAAEKSVDPGTAITSSQAKAMEPEAAVLSPLADQFMQMIEYGEKSELALQRIIADQVHHVQNDHFEYKDLAKFIKSLEMEFIKLRTDLGKYSDNITAAPAHDPTQRVTVMDNAVLLLKRAARKFDVLDMVLEDNQSNKWLSATDHGKLLEAKQKFELINTVLTQFKDPAAIKAASDVEKKQKLAVAAQNLQDIENAMNTIHLKEPAM